MLGKLFKPKWQHKNPQVRIQSLATLDCASQELISLATNDPDSTVRMEAITYLTHIPTLVKLGNAAGSIGERARNRVIGLAGNESQHDDLLVEVFAWLNNPALLSSLARDSERGSKLRQLAIAKLDDQTLLLEIANNDPSREIQYTAASHINDFDKLKQLEKTHGRNNKRLRQLLRERMEQEQNRLQQQEELNKLCNEAESLGKKGTWEQDKTRSKVLEQSWSKLAEQASDDLQERFHKALTDFHQHLHAHEEQEQHLHPLREAQQTILTTAAELYKHLQETPEQYTLSAVDTNIQTLQQNWEQAEELPTEEQVRQETIWQKRLQKLNHLRNTIGDDLAALEQLKRLENKAESLKKQTRPLQSKTILTLQTEWVNAKRPQTLRKTLGELESHFRHTLDLLNSRLEKQRKEREKVLKHLHGDLQQLEEHLETEQYSEAIELHHTLTQRLKETTDLPKKDTAFFQRRIQMLTPYIRELQDWRRWGTNQVRKQLIETAEHLREEDELDPQERAKKVQSLRQEWRKLANMEPHQQRKLWKEFDSTVSAAYEPSKQHFAEQARQREENLQKRQALCSELESLHTSTDWENINWREQQNKLNNLRKQWKNAGTVNHKEWKKINQRFNAAIDALDVHFKTERTRNWQEREQLINRAQALLENPNTMEAIEQAKALQQEWQVTVPSRHASEQKLWKQFREPIDTLFARAQEERQQKRDTQKARLAEEKQRLLAQQEKAREHLQQQLAELDTLAAQSVTNKQATLDNNVLTSNQTIGEELLLQMEILLELSTPQEFQRARMEYQVNQMSAAMLGRQDEDSSWQKATTLLKQWYALEGMPETALQHQTARIDTVRQAIQTGIQASVELV